MFPNRFEPSIGGIERQCKLLSIALKKKEVNVIVLTDRFSLDLPKYEIINDIPIYRLFSLWILRKTFSRIIKLFKKVGLHDFSTSSYSETKRSHGPKSKTIMRRLNRILFYKIPLYTFFLSCLIALYRLRRDYDIIQVFKTNLLAVAAVLIGRLTSKPVVVRDAIVGGMDELKEFMLWRLTSTIVSEYCTFVALSSHIEMDLRKRGIPDTRIVRIPNAVEIPSEHSNKNIISKSVLFIGNVQGDMVQKGLDILLKAWRLVTGVVSDATLTVIGDGDFTPFEVLAYSLDIGQSVHFKGIQKNIFPWFEQSSIFVLPSRYEGMSNALLEAMSYGKACIVTQISGSDDLIQHSLNGLKVARENIDELAKAIIYLLTDPLKAEQFGKNARETVATLHRPELIADKYINLYNNLLN